MAEYINMRINPADYIEVWEVEDTLQDLFEQAPTIIEAEGE